MEMRRLSIHTFQTITIHHGQFGRAACSPRACCFMKKGPNYVADNKWRGPDNDVE